MLGQPLDETETWVKALYYGNPGSAKTTAMATLANLGPMVAVDFEGQGWLKEPLRKRGVNVENVRVFRPRSYDELEQVYWECVGMLENGELLGVAIDHMSELEAILVRDASIDRIKRARRKLLLNGSTEAREQAELLSEFVTELADYGVWTNQARKLTRLFRDLPCHVAFGAHVRTEQAKFVPALTEKFRNDLMGSMNMVCATTSVEMNGGVEYLGTFREMDRYVGKDRYDVTKPKMVHPHMDRLVKLVRGELDLDTDPVTQAFKQRIGG